MGSHSTSVSIKCVTSLDRVSPASHQPKVFGSNRLMEDYVDTYRQNPDKPYWCQMCNKGFQSLTGFQLHMQAHQGRKFMCTICDARFNQKVHLKTHLRGIHRAAQCIQCSEVNTVSSGPRFGLIKSANRNLLAWCEKCQLSIPSGKLYNRHVSHRHPELLPYSCHICGQECKDQSQRSAHGLHAEVSRLGPSSSFGSAVHVVWCSYCNLRLPSHKAYQKHLCEHHQEALPFRCELCGKAFYIKDHLRLHMRSHRGRVFPCDLCNSKFKFKHHLKNHIKCVHKMTQCGKCMTNFETLDEYYVHLNMCPLA
ncbi:zinc finger protein 236 isoform X14 [Biomphalaria glabrata]|nr:zinc finger protein 236 isoform X14 [Biomphalaria glabrata]